MEKIKKTDVEWPIESSSPMNAQNYVLDQLFKGAGDGVMWSLRSPSRRTCCG